MELKQSELKKETGLDVFVLRAKIDLLNECISEIYSLVEQYSEEDFDLRRQAIEEEEYNQNNVTDIQFGNVPKGVYIYHEITKEENQRMVLFAQELMRNEVEEILGPIVPSTYELSEEEKDVSFITTISPALSAEMSCV